MVGIKPHDSVRVIEHAYSFEVEVTEALHEGTELLSQGLHRPIVSRACSLRTSSTYTCLSLVVGVGEGLMDHGHGQQSITLSGTTCLTHHWGSGQYGSAGSLASILPYGSILSECLICNLLLRNCVQVTGGV